MSKPDWAERLQRTFKRKYDLGYEEGYKVGWIEGKKIMSVIVYSNPNCTACEQTKRFLTLKEIPFESKMISESPEVFALIEEKGYASAPVVVAGEDNWAGFRLDRLNSLVKE